MGAGQAKEKVKIAPWKKSKRKSGQGRGFPPQKCNLTPREAGCRAVNCAVGNSFSIREWQEPP